MLKSRRRLQDPDFGRLAYALARMRGKYGFVVTAWVFLPDLRSTSVWGRRETHSLRSGQGCGKDGSSTGRWDGEYHETVGYIRWNPVRRGLVQRQKSGNGRVCTRTRVSVRRNTNEAACLTT
ncbi:MAG: hypothetical protein ACLQOO_28615 [Terriglobia bacterium]